jgi:hypothetical protein
MQDERKANMENENRKNNDIEKLFYTILFIKVDGNSQGIDSFFNSFLPEYESVPETGNNIVFSCQAVKDWLQGESITIDGILGKTEHKDEYAIQISYIPSEICEHIPELGPEVRRIRSEMVKKSSETIYTFQQKLEKVLKLEIEKLVDLWFNTFFIRINEHVDKIIIEKNRQIEKDKIMILNLSCLVAKEEVKNLVDELEKINNMEGFSVHYSGPWPPCSFRSDTLH